MRDLIQGVNQATALGMVFFMIIALHFAVVFHRADEKNKELLNKNTTLQVENSNLRTNWKACKEEKSRWYKRTVSCEGW
jgi:FtsZ-binding cell division protein ZapB